MATTYGLILGSGWSGFGRRDAGSEVETAFGLPSAPVHRLCFGDVGVFCLARHGESHTIPPHLVNYRANVLALKKLGVDAVVGVNTVGVISGLCRSGQLAVPAQLIDYTWGRAHTIYDTRRGNLTHIDFTAPFSESLRAGLLAAAAKAGVPCHDGGVYAVTQGPRLETAAEIDRLERDGADFVGMTLMPEAAIAREAGLEYACLAMIVNEAAGRGDEPIHAAVDANTAKARNATMSTLEAFFAAV